MGHSFRYYTKDAEWAVMAGMPLSKARHGRTVETKLCMAFAHVMREDDQRLLEQCSNIALTEDTRAGYEVVRARLTMGRGLPAGMSPPAAPGAEARPRGVQAAPHSGGHTHGSVTLVNGCHGKHIFIVERLLTLRKQAAYETTPPSSSPLT